MYLAFAKLARQPFAMGVAVLLAIAPMSNNAIADDIGNCKLLDEKSFKFCEKLAEAGNPDGMYGLGVLFFEGKGVKKDLGRSFKFMYESSILGNIHAQMSVGLAYLNGHGVAREIELAYAWFLVSKENGNPLSQQGIDFINQNNLIKPSQMNAVTQVANDIYAKIKNKKGYDFGPSSEISVGDIIEYCDQVMPTVETAIVIKKYGKPKSDVHQLMIGMTDKRAISMMNGVIEWVWNTNVPIEKMRERFRDKCLTRHPDVSFIFP